MATTATFYVSDVSGDPLLKPNDGFIVHGAIMKADNQGGLIGGQCHIEVLEKSNIEPFVFSNFEFFDALNLPPQVFIDYYNARKHLIKQPTGIITRDKHFDDLDIRAHRASSGALLFEGE